MEFVRLIALAAVAGLAVSTLRAAEGPGVDGAFKIGVASADITPDGPIWLAGYASRNRPSEAVEHPLHAKAIAFEDARGMRAVLVAADLIGLHRDLAEAIAKDVRKRTGLGRERLLLASSHTHAAPVLDGAPLQMYAMPEAERRKVAAYTRRVREAIADVVARALEALAPGRLAFGHGVAHIAGNRRVFTAQGVRFGYNPDGPVDDDVPVLAARGEKGALKALLFGYACHGTTLTGDCYRVCGDYMGFAQAYLEAAHPGATALFAAGCGADADPYPRGTMACARQNGLVLAGAVAHVAGRPMRPVRGPIRCAFRRVDLAFADPPSREVLRERLASPNPHVRRHARALLAILERDGALPRTYPYPIQVWRFGDDLVMVALAGEVVVDYALRLKRELGPDRLWVVAYANDVFGYIGSARILLEGGYEADFSTIYYTLPSRWASDVEERIVAAVRELVETTGP